MNNYIIFSEMILNEMFGKNRMEIRKLSEMNYQKKEKPSDEESYCLMERLFTQRNNAATVSWQWQWIRTRCSVAMQNKVSYRHLIMQSKNSYQRSAIY